MFTRRLQTAIALAALVISSSDAAAQDRAARGYLTDSAMAFLEPMIGSWRPLNVPDSILQANPPIVAHDYSWTVGGNAIQLREGFVAGNEEASQLNGLIYWNPATERVEFVAVAGHGEGEGRLFVGEYHPLEDGSIERTYDVFYRTLADMPGEIHGGSRRRYREVYRLETPDRVSYTLDWFHDGSWRPFGRWAEGAFQRIPES